MILFYFINFNVVVFIIIFSVWYLTLLLHEFYIVHIAMIDTLASQDCIEGGCHIK